MESFYYLLMGFMVKALEKPVFEYEVTVSV